MQSIKNSAVTIILLFLSYGVYQVITQPLPNDSESVSTDILQITDPTQPREPAFTESPNDFLTSLKSPAASSSFDKQNDFEFNSDDESIPPQLLELEAPESLSFQQNALERPQPPASLPAADRLPEDNRFENSFNPSFSKETTGINTNQNRFPVAHASNPSDFAPDNQSTRVVDYQNNFNTAPATDSQHLASDSQIIPQTLTTGVAERPSTGNLESGNNLLRPNPQPTLAESWPMIQSLVAESKFQEALTQLSQFYRTENYDAAQLDQLLDWLDALAAKVIYSSEHHLRSTPYVIQPGDTIGSLARQWQVPAQLIYNVNARSIADPNQLQPGTQIKLIEGPFDAEINSQSGLMTLYLDNLYAGRFAVQPGPSVAPGEFQIVDKSVSDQTDRPFWMQLNNGGSIFASTSRPNDSNAISMNQQEAEEVFSILSATSRIRVLR